MKMDNILMRHKKRVLGQLPLIPLVQLGPMVLHLATGRVGHRHFFLRRALVNAKALFLVYIRSVKKCVAVNPPHSA